MAQTHPEFTAQQIKSEISEIGSESGDLTKKSNISEKEFGNSETGIREDVEIYSVSDNLKSVE
jgi:hypothetical protein